MDFKIVEKNFKKIGVPLEFQMSAIETISEAILNSSQEVLDILTDYNENILSSRLGDIIVNSFYLLSVCEIDIESTIDNSLEEKFKNIETFSELLTTKFIESEGFIHVGGKLISSGDQIFNKGNHMLKFCFSNKSLVILIKDPAMVKDYYLEPSFRGVCRTTEEFLTIIKCLKLNG